MRYFEQVLTHLAACQDWVTIESLELLTQLQDGALPTVERELDGWYRTASAVRRGSDVGPYRIGVYYADPVHDARAGVVEAAARRAVRRLTAAFEADAAALCAVLEDERLERL